MKKLLLFLVVLSSCKAPQSVTVYKDVVKVDTIRDYKVITKFDAVHDTLTIENPCDSTGILNTFYSKIKIPQGQVIIRTVRGKIQATVNIDSIAQVYESKYRSKKDTDVTNISKIVTKNVIPKWAIWFMAITSLLSILYIRDKIRIFAR